jgi:hypothetical protein
MARVSIPELAARRRLSYQQALRLAFRGELGVLERDGARWVVHTSDEPTTTPALGRGV